MNWSSPGLLPGPSGAFGASEPRPGGLWRSAAMAQVVRKAEPSVAAKPTGEVLLKLHFSFLFLLKLALFPTYLLDFTRFSVV